MKRVLPHVICHGIALALIIAGGITGYIYFLPVGIVFEMVFWFYVVWLSHKRRETRSAERHKRRVAGDETSLAEEDTPNT